MSRPPGPAWPEVDRSPARLSAAASLALALASVAVTGAFAWSALALGGLGFAWLLAGLVRGSGRAATAGGVALFAGVLAAGVVGAPGVAVVLGATTAILAWDAAWRAITVGAHLGRDADSGRLQVAGLGASLLAGLAVAGLTYGVYRAASGGQPLVALVFLLVAAALVASAFA